MSSIVNRLTVDLFETAPYAAIAQSVGLLVVILTILLLLGRELIRAHGGRPLAAGAIRAIDVAAVPLIPASMVVILLRTLEFL